MALSRARFPLLLALLGATACLPALDSPDTGTPAAVDEDGDGYTADEDCDDQDADVHPGASEICNELDDDCDDAVDDEDADLDTTSAELWYQDADEDGYGSEDVSMYACEQPDGYGQLTADCDDGDAEVNPGATEICNTVDDDCDGLIDDEDDSLDLESAALWFADSDGDGYGDAEAKDYGCDQISGYVDDGTDCDDEDDSVFPGAKETWYDGVDSNCDEAGDFDQDGDGHDSDEWGGDDCADTDAALYPGATSDHAGYTMVYVCPGSYSQGSPAGEEGHQSDEELRSVTLTRGFYIGAYPVTEGEFGALAGYRTSYPSVCDGCPAQHADWHEAAALANALSDAVHADRCYTCTGSEDFANCWLASGLATPYDCEGYRLPTEAEWEYAARAGTASAFSNGANLSSGTGTECRKGLTLDDGSYLDDIAVYCGSFVSEPQPVGTTDPNAWGLYDVHGNVREWCDDGYASTYDNSTVDPWYQAANAADDRVSRNTSYAGYPTNLRTAHRGPANPSTAASDLGFRLVISE